MNTLRIHIALKLISLRLSRILSIIIQIWLYQIYIIDTVDIRIIITSVVIIINITQIVIIVVIIDYTGVAIIIGRLECTVC
jgi:hypothetical protein